MSNEIIGHVEYLPEYPYTAAQEDEYHRDQDKVSALEESAHAVAAWLLGVPIHRMKYNNESSPSLVEHPKGPGIITDAAADIFIGNCSLSELQAKSPGERFVHACEHAFITFAGPRGSGQATSTNPFYTLQTHLHLEQARAKFMDIAGSSEHTANQECARLLHIVESTFQDPRVQWIVEYLAKNFLRLRDMTGEEVTACIARALWHRT